MNILDFLFPKHCVYCGRIGGYFCDCCRFHIKTIAAHEAICPVCEKSAIGGSTHPRCKGRYTPDGLTVFFHYDGAIRSAIKTLKYRLVTDLAEEFISLIQNSLLVNNSVLIPIPLHPSRLRERGFNQAEILGRLLSKKLNITMRTDILKRARETVPQAEIERRKDRMENMKNVFVCNDVFHKQAERYKNILLFDDVFTTGTTMREATSVLKRAGARWVWCVTMAR